MSREKKAFVPPEVVSVPMAGRPWDSERYPVGAVRMGYPVAKTEEVSVEDRPQKEDHRE